MILSRQQCQSNVYGCLVFNGHKKPSNDRVASISRGGKIAGRKKRLMTAARDWVFRLPRVVLPKINLSVEFPT
eukprot:scaffold1007_cov176-Amphora_coffeaeformis.AAC.30